MWALIGPGARRYGPAAACEDRFGAALRHLLGRSQVVRQRILIPPFRRFESSRPSQPVRSPGFYVYDRQKARTFGTFCASFSLEDARGSSQNLQFLPNASPQYLKNSRFAEKGAETSSTTDCATDLAVAI